MTFLKWILDHYLRIRKQSSVHQYWRQWRMLRRKCVGRSLHARVADEVNDVRVLLQPLQRETTDRYVIVYQWVPNCGIQS